MSFIVQLYYIQMKVYANFGLFLYFIMNMEIFTAFFYFPKRLNFSHKTDIPCYWIFEKSWVQWLFLCLKSIFKNKNLLIQTIATLVSKM